MAITTNAICNSFKKELLQGKHDFDTSSDTYKLAMYTSSATLDIKNSIIIMGARSSDNKNIYCYSF